MFAAKGNETMSIAEFHIGPAVTETAKHVDILQETLRTLFEPVA